MSTVVKRYISKVKSLSSFSKLFEKRYMYARRKNAISFFCFVFCNGRVFQSFLFGILVFFYYFYSNLFEIGMRKCLQKYFERVFGDNPKLTAVYHSQLSPRNTLALLKKLWQYFDFRKSFVEFFYQLTYFREIKFAAEKFTQ